MVRTISRGVRIPEARFMQIYEIWRNARKNRAVQVNEVFDIVVELGLTAFSELPQSMQDGMFKKRKFEQETKFKESVRSKVRTVSLSLRLDDRLGFALPRPIKQILREEARRSETSMSAIARSEILSRVKKEKA